MLPRRSWLVATNVAMGFWGSGEESDHGEASLTCTASCEYVPEFISVWRTIGANESIMWVILV